MKIIISFLLVALSLATAHARTEHFLDRDVRAKIIALFSFITKSYNDEEKGTAHMEKLQKYDIAQYSFFDYNYEVTNGKTKALVVVFNGTASFGDALYDANIAREDGKFINEYEGDKNKSEASNMYASYFRYRYYNQHNSIAIYTLSQISIQLATAARQGNGYEKVIFTGHSLGGSLALYAYSASTRSENQILKSIPKEICLFNPAGLPEFLANNMDQKMFQCMSEDNSSLLAYYHIVNENDFLYSWCNEFAQLRIPKYDNGNISAYELIELSSPEIDTSLNPNEFASLIPLASKMKLGVTKVIPKKYRSAFKIGKKGGEVLAEMVYAHGITNLHSLFVVQTTDKLTEHPETDILLSRLCDRLNTTLVYLKQLNSDKSLANNEIFAKQFGVAFIPALKALMAADMLPFFNALKRKKQTNSSKSTQKELQRIYFNEQMEERIQPKLKNIIALIKPVAPEICSMMRQNSKLPKNLTQMYTDFIMQLGSKSATKFEMQ